MSDFQVRPRKINVPETPEEAVAFRLCWVEVRKEYDVLFIDCGKPEMQVSRRSPPGHDANVLCGAIRRAIVAGIQQSKVPV